MGYAATLLLACLRLPSGNSLVPSDLDRAPRVSRVVVERVPDQIAKYERELCRASSQLTQGPDDANRDVRASAGCAQLFHHPLYSASHIDFQFVRFASHASVLTARSHRAADEEGFFLFYTDTAVPARPLLGALNLGAGLLRSALAVAQVPFDGGRALRSGLTGVVFSLPELLFQNIRKGYKEYVPPGERPPPG